MARYFSVKLKFCEGCLSADRSLIDLDDYEISMFYSFTKIDRKGDALQLCWECKAILRKFIKFKQQVKHAHFILNSYNENVKTLSNLVNHKNLDLIDFVYTGTNIPLEVDISLIKQEDDCTNDFADEDCLTGKESKLQINIKNDLHRAKEIIECAKEIENTGEDFNESDDEPLIVRKTEKKRKNKTENNKAKQATRQNRKRELPSGVVYNERVKRKLEKLNMADDRLQLVMLSWEEVEEERQRTLQSESFTRHSYRCHHCAVGFNHKCKLDNHMKKHDKSNGTAECNICHIVCKDSHSLAAHKRRHRIRWRCSSCGRGWSRPSLGADHIARAHGGRAPTHVCALCGHVAATLAKLRNHEKNHTERPKCDLCGKTFRDKTSLKTHLFIHNGEKEFECPRCNKRFLFKKAMEVHLVTHDASALLYCHVCDKNFKNKMSYNQHLKYNLKHIDPARLKYACQVCDKKFINSTRLEEHNLAVHLKLTPISCALPGCNFACSSRTVLRSHRRLQHRAARLCRNHVCHVCGKTYTTKKCLEGHLRTHTGERPFTCSKCPAAFGYEAVLYNHNKLVHLKNKPNHRNTE